MTEKLRKWGRIMNNVMKKFLEQADWHPDNVAVLDIRGAYTYDQLNHRTAYLAGKILALLSREGTQTGRVALLLPRTKDYLTALLAVLRAGCAAVPMDAEYPAERVRAMLEDVGCGLCVTSKDREEDLSGTPCLFLEDVFPDGVDVPEADTALDHSDPDAEGLILYTSGSTGKPKGVVHRQKVLSVNPDTMTGILPLSEDTRTLCIAGFSFIASLIDLTLPLFFGGSVYVANETERKNVDMIWALFAKRGITGMFLPPQMYSVMRKLHGPLPLQYVLLSGEKARVEHTADDPPVYEFYGASESPAMLLHSLGEGDSHSLGKPCRGITAYLMEENGSLITKPGVIGELCVDSPYMAVGYHGLPEETAKKFAVHPSKPGKRLFHTGDYMAWDENGDLIFHGRKDHMVKIRGYRVELDEVRRAAARFEGVEEAACVPVRVNGGDHICCYYTGRELSKEALKAFIGALLPEYMVPEYCVHLDSMPRNDRNKVDYSALKAMEIKTEDAEYEPPVTEMEKTICQAFAVALEMERVSANADFFAWGGTSLSAAFLVSNLSEAYTISFQDISAHPTPRKLAAFLESSQSAGQALPPMDREDYPLTKTQLGIYLESLTGGSKETYTCSYLAQAAPEVGAEQLIDAARKVIAAHPGTKYIIRAGADGMPRMVMTPEAEIEIPVFEGTEEVRLDFMKSFMPVVPMMDSVLLHLAVYRTPVRCYLAIKSHLIFFDGTAISQFIAEMNRALAGKPLAGEACTIQQAAMIEERQLADGTHESAEAYYRNLFQDAEDVPALSGDLNGPLTPGVSENLRYEPGTLSAERVKAFCEREHISESSFFIGAMALMLGKYLNSKHVSFSTVYNGRPLAEMNHTMGTLIKRIPVYGDLRRDRPVGEFLRGISKQIFTTMANDIYSFDEVLKTCPVNEDVEFIYQGDLFTDQMGADAGETLLQGDKWFMEHYHTGMVTGCMSIQFFSTAGLYNMTVEYRNEKFSEKWARRFAQDLFTTAEQLLTASSIGQISLLTAEDRKRLAAFNDTAVPMEFIPVHEQIHRRALAQPDKAAVIAAGKRLTFRELDQFSNALAEVLIAKGAGTERLIGVLFDREIWAYVAEIAILKAGAAFLPFIPEYPDDRIDFCLEDGVCPLLLTTAKQMKGRSLSEKGYAVLTLEEAFHAEDPDNVHPNAAEYPEVSVTPENLAYCIYTSGSTGRPKGVMIEHRNIMNYVHRNEKSVEIMHYAAPGRVNLALASFSFDVSVVEEFVPLCNGNTVVIATEAEIHDPALFARLVKETGVDGITCTPTYLLSLLEIPESREAIRQFAFFDIGAEAFPRQLYDRLRELRQDSVILNVYGPTECTMGCAAALMTGGEQVTVGPPIANTVFYVADPFGAELPVGMKGELIICGDQVGRGYVNLPEKSAAAFFTHDGLRAYHSGDLAAWTEDGEVRIFGRIDNQIKLRGFRIELDEIEKVMTEFPGVSSSAAAVRKMGGTEYLAGYFTAKEAVDADALKAFMQEKLPEYMVPNVLTRLDEMPMTQNGKVNRKALPEPDIQALKAEYIPPENEVEKTLCDAFARTLKLEEGKVGLMDDFFDLGGDSLRAMVVLADAKLDGLTAADVFQLRTPGAIAKELEKRAGQESLPEREAKALLVPHDLSPLQLQMIDNQLFRPNSTMWSNMHFLALFPEVDAEKFCGAVNKALKNHPALSVAFFFDENNELKQKYVPGLLPEVKVMDILPETEDALSDILLLPFHRILNACLCKVNVLRGRKGCYLFMDVHHLLMDGGSLGVVLGDVVNAYFGRELKPDYYFAMLAEAEERAAAGSVADDRAWFAERYGDREDDWCNIPAPDHDSGNINQAGRMRRLGFDAAQVEEAERFWGVSHSVMAISAGLIALSRFTGKKHVMINWIFNNRLAPEAENVVGMLIRNLPAAIRMEEVSSVRNLLQSVKEQVAEGIAHGSWDFMSETRHAYVNDCMEVNLQLGINGDEMDALPHELIELNDEFSAAGARLELELLENEFGDGGFDSEMEYAEGLFDRERIETFHDLYVQILEDLIHKRTDI